jgi:hypothetical protein
MLEELYRSLAGDHIFLMENFQHFLLTQLIAIIQSTTVYVTIGCFEECEGRTSEDIHNFIVSIFGITEF